MHGLFRARRMEESHKVLEEMEANGLVPSGLFDGLSRNGDSDTVSHFLKSR